MATAKKAATKAATKAKSRAPARRMPRKAKAGTTGLAARDVVLPAITPELAPAAQRVIAAGGAIIGFYKDPFGGHPLLLASLPIDAVEPTPFQRDLSEMHHKRLADVIQRTGRFLDPIIAVTAPDHGLWTPNGRHRLEAMRRLGARSIMALVVPDRAVAWQILALNTEKAHNTKERSLEVIRIYRGLVAEDASRPESSFAFYLEEPAFVTLGVCYERAPRFAGGAYHPVLRRVEQFSDAPIGEAIGAHEELAAATLEVEAAVARVIDALKAKGLTS
ncbi:MAG TPA: ParB N-terminal domain-containing protein, partial [Minicystis sp.]|nr:ParB N-terminal domain-containing protein [Minicystis sp.]